MKNGARLVPVVAGLVLLLTISPSSGQPVCASPGCNPTASDDFANTAGGTDALKNLHAGPVGSQNTAFGFDALVTEVGGHANTAIGAHALRSNNVGLYNTATGAMALFNNLGDTNTAIGAFVLNVNTTGSMNTGIGFRALRDSTGQKNIGIGYQAGVTLGTGNNNIYIGNQGAGDESQTIRIGTAQAQTFIAGINAATVGDAQVMVDTTTGQLGIVTSSARYKQDVETMANRSEGLLKLRPVTFSYKDDAATAPHYGLIAEEVATVYPELITRTPEGEVQTVKYHELIPMLLNELQRLQAKVTALEALVGSRLEK